MIFSRSTHVATNGIISFFLMIYIFINNIYLYGFPSDSVIKNQSAMQETWVKSLGWGDPLEKEMEPTPVFLPGKSHGQRSLAGYSP